MNIYTRRAVFESDLQAVIKTTNNALQMPSAWQKTMTDYEKAKQDPKNLVLAGGWAPMR
jgi:hypothetical protein